MHAVRDKGFFSVHGVSSFVIGYESSSAQVWLPPYRLIKRLWIEGEAILVDSEKGFKRIYSDGSEERIECRGRKAIFFFKARSKAIHAELFIRAAWPLEHIECILTQKDENEIEAKIGEEIFTIRSSFPIKLEGEEITGLLDGEGYMAVEGNAYVPEKKEKEYVTIKTSDTRSNRWIKQAIENVEKFYLYTPGIGYGFVAGYNVDQEDKGRPGFAWYFGRDFLWMAPVITILGYRDEVKNGFRLLAKYQSKEGKIMHELSMSTELMGLEDWKNVGCYFAAADSTPLYIIALETYLRLTGDLDFIKELKGSIERCFSYMQRMDHDGDGFIDNIEGHGWVEGGFLAKDQRRSGHTTFYLASLQCKAYESYAKILKALGEVSSDVEDLFIKAKEKLNEFYSGSYFYHRKTPSGYGKEITVLPCVAGALKILDYDKARSHLRYVNDWQIDNGWGTRIVSYADRNYNPEGYHEGSVWPLFTGWASVCNYNYDNPIQGYRQLMENLQLLDDWSYRCSQEVINGDVYRPIGCPQQGWSDTMSLFPLFFGILGIDCDNGIPSFSIRMPPGWKSIEVKNLKLLDKNFEITVERSDKRISVRISPDVHCVVRALLPGGSEIEYVKEACEGKRIDFKTERNPYGLYCTVTSCNFEIIGKVCGEVLAEVDECYVTHERPVNYQQGDIAIGSVEYSDCWRIEISGKGRRILKLNFKPKRVFGGEAVNNEIRIDFGAYYSTKVVEIYP